MEKYHDLIVSLIKAHRKYPGCEPILEDIVADVYAHAEVVLNTVTNESVINSYLNKIISTSMVTVPKRLGIKSVTSAKVIESVIKNAEDLVQEDKTDEIILPDTPDIISESNEEASDEDFLNEEEADEELTFELQRDEATSEAEGVFDTTEDSSIEICEDVDDNEDEITEASEEITSNDTEESFEEIHEEVQESDVDKSLVDKMINGVTKPEELIEEAVDVSETEVSLFSEEDNEPVLEDTVLAEPEITEDEGLNIDFGADISEDDLNDLESFAAGENSPSNDTGEQTQKQETDGEYSVPSYKCFEFAHTKEDIDVDFDDIIPKLKELQNKYTDNDVSEILRLKYSEKLSVDDIASKLNITDEVILDILKELMYIVKE